MKNFLMKMLAPDLEALIAKAVKTAVEDALDERLQSAVEQEVLNSMPSPKEISEELDLSEIADEMSARDIASELDVSDIANEIDCSDVAQEIDTDALAVALMALRKKARSYK